MRSVTCPTPLGIGKQNPSSWTSSSCSFLWPASTNQRCIRPGPVGSASPRPPSKQLHIPERGSTAPSGGRDTGRNQCRAELYPEKTGQVQREERASCWRRTDAQRVPELQVLEWVWHNPEAHTSPGAGSHGWSLTAGASSLV